nr:MAG TPA: hypothetical protein [Caudoviricetes sp.]
MDNKELRDGIIRTTLLVQILKELEKELDKKKKTKEEEKCGPEPTNQEEPKAQWMTFAEALTELQNNVTNGYMIRADWIDKVVFIASTGSDTLYLAQSYLDEDGKIREEYICPYHATDADLLEWEWSVVDEDYAA